MKDKRVIKKINADGQKIIFRYPERSDLDDLLELINGLVEDKAMITVQKKMDKKGETKWLGETLRKIRRRESVYLVVEIEGKIMGGATIDKDFLRPHLGMLGIILGKGIQGRGIGGQLIEAVIEEAKKVLSLKIVTLFAMAQNTRAIKLYLKCGFQEVGWIKGGVEYYGDYVDEVSMVKYL